MQIPNLYRLYDIQDFHQMKIAIYIKHGEFQNLEILHDSINICNKKIEYKNLTHSKPWLYGESKQYNGNAIWSNEMRDNRYQVKLNIVWINKAINIINNNSFTQYAIFKNNRKQIDWRGSTELFKNNYLDIYKTDIPTYSGCELLKTIIL